MSSWRRDADIDADADVETEYHTWSFQLEAESWPVPCGLPRLAVLLGGISGWLPYSREGGY
jgi:hypothetical protein